MAKEIKFIREPSKNILVSFSGGETSAYMLLYILERYRNTHKIVIVFANTGEENEETLLFVKQVSDYIHRKYGGRSIQWIEFERPNKRHKKKGGGYTVRHQVKEVDYHTAYRSHNPKEVKLKWPNHPFRKMIEYFGIPNRMYKHCSRELKGETIRRWLKKKHKLTYGKDVTVAIGIRADEMDRMGIHWYPLAIEGITKPMINTFWQDMPFRLQLAGWQGNCKVCWKKSNRKLCTIYRHSPEKFEPFEQFVKEFEDFKPIRNTNRQRKELETKLRFFRGNMNTSDIAELSKEDFPDAEDDSIIYVEGLDSNNGCEESCEAF